MPVKGIIEEEESDDDLHRIRRKVLNVVEEEKDTYKQFEFEFDPEFKEDLVSPI